MSGDIKYRGTQCQALFRGHEVSGDMKCQGTSSVRRYEVSGDILISGFSQGHQVSGDNYVRISQGTSSVWGHQVSGDIKCHGSQVQVL